MENKIWNLDIRIILLTVNWQRQNIWQWCNDIKVLSRIQIFKNTRFRTPGRLMDYNLLLNPNLVGLLRGPFCGGGGEGGNKTC